MRLLLMGKAKVTIKLFNGLLLVTTLVNLLYIELMLHHSNVKQMYCQHLTHELILWVQIKTLYQMF